MLAIGSEWLMLSLIVTSLWGRVVFKMFVGPERCGNSLFCGSGEFPMRPGELKCEASAFWRSSRARHSLEGWILVNGKETY